MDAGRQALFFKFPEEYYQYAVQWCSYPHWTIEEAANLLTGCVPHREMLLRGKAMAALDAEVLVTENLLRAALHSELEVVKSQKHFGKTYLLSEQVLNWAESNVVDMPEDLLKAAALVSEQHACEAYTTPCLQAIAWVIENYWEHANLREPPSAGSIIQALLQQFPQLSGAECDMVERVTRHPLARPD